MAKYTDEIKRLTLDPGARRLGEIADALAAELTKIRNDCCGGSGPSISPPQPDPATEPPR